MLHLILGVLGILMGFFGVFTNIYVLLVLLLSKKARSNGEWILLHLSSCGLGTSLFNLCFSSPSIIFVNWVSYTDTPLCEFVGAAILALQLLTVWSICALSADRCAAIVSPLRYTQVVTRRRIAVYFIITWIVSVVTVFAALCLSTLQEENISKHSIPPTPTAVHNISTINIEEVLQYSSTEIPSTFIMTAVEESELMSESQSHHNNNHHHHHPNPNHNFNQQQSNEIFNNINNHNNNNNIIIINNSSSKDIIKIMEYNNDTVRYFKQSENIIISPINTIVNTTSLPFEFRPLLGLCLPKVYTISWVSVLWTSEWIIFTLIAPICTFLICDLTVLSIARRQRHRIVMALYQITLSAQATVTRSKGTDPPSLWFNRTVPAKSRACRAVFEDLISVLILHLPLILILVVETIGGSQYDAPDSLVFIGSLCLFLMPTTNAFLYGVRARPLRTAYKSYLRKRLTNSTLQHEIQQRLSPVDGSPRPSSRAKSFRSSNPNSPTWSPIQTPARRLSGNDLRPPPMHLSLRLSPSHDHIGRTSVNHNKTNCKSGLKTRKVRSFLHIPSQHDMQELWSGLRKPNRSPTIVITHEIRVKDSSASLFTPSSSPPNAEHML